MTYDERDLDREYDRGHEAGYDAGYSQGYVEGELNVRLAPLSSTIDARLTIPHAIDPTEGFTIRWDAPLSVWIVTQGEREVMVRDET